VAHVAEITAADPRKDPAERARIPAYYLAEGRVADFWFRLWDIRRLVQDDTERVSTISSSSATDRYEDKPVSIYGGMVDLPPIVTEPEPVQYFDEATRAQVTGGAFWVEFDAGQTGGGRLARDLRQNLFGDEAWHRLDPATRTFVVTAERIFRDHVDDPALDLAPTRWHSLPGEIVRPAQSRIGRRLDSAGAVELSNGGPSRGLGRPPAHTGRLGPDHRLLEGDGRLPRRHLAGRPLARGVPRPGPGRVRPAPRPGGARGGRGGTRSRARSCGRRNGRSGGRSASSGAGRGDVIRWHQRILGIGREGVLARLAGVRPLRG
jgi:hypothetical protein